MANPQRFILDRVHDEGIFTLRRAGSRVVRALRCTECDQETVNPSATASASLLRTYVNRGWNIDLRKRRFICPSCQEIPPEQEVAPVENAEKPLFTYSMVGTMYVGGVSPEQLESLNTAQSTIEVPPVILRVRTSDRITNFYFTLNARTREALGLEAGHDRIAVGNHDGALVIFPSLYASGTQPCNVTSEGWEYRIPVAPEFDHAHGASFEMLAEVRGHADDAGSRLKFPFLSCLVDWFEVANFPKTEAPEPAPTPDADTHHDPARDAADFGFTSPAPLPPVTTTLTLTAPPETKVQRAVRLMREMNDAMVAAYHENPQVIIQLAVDATKDGPPRLRMQVTEATVYE